LQYLLDLAKTGDLSFPLRSQQQIKSVFSQLDDKYILVLRYYLGPAYSSDNKEYRNRHFCLVLPS
jgi:hypothetical protein